MGAYLDWIKKKIGGKLVCVYPLGVGGKCMVDKLREMGITVDYVGNREYLEEGYNGIDYLPLEDMEEKKDNLLIVVESSKYYWDIKKELNTRGINNILRIYYNKFLADEYLEKEKNLKDKLEQLKKILYDDKSCHIADVIVSSWSRAEIEEDYFCAICDKQEYFDENLIRLDDAEVYVDGGAYTGDTAKAFFEYSKGHFSSMHLFELDNSIYKQLEKNIEKINCTKIHCYPYGLSDKKEKVQFSSGNGNSSIGNGTCEGYVNTLDTVLGEENVTFIKLDIEGSELKALRGAQNIIKKCKPQLAICLYHKPEDMFEIPRYIKSLVPEYKIYIRHYSELLFDTICYAIP